MQTVPFNFKGLDRSTIPYRADKSTFYDLLNMRHNRDVFGLLEQTPYFGSRQAPQGTYFSGGSQTEPSSSRVRLIRYGTVVTDYVIYRSLAVQAGDQLPVFYQTVNTTSALVTTGCRLVIDNLAGLGITLGNRLEVEMTGAATFRWRKNGGVWSGALVPSKTGVSIDGGNATLYFLASSGFAGTETWSWQRTDCSWGDSSYLIGDFHPTAIFYKKVCYFTSLDARVMAQQFDTVGSSQYCISVGYRPVYGTNLTVFDDHLIVARYATTANTYYAPPRNFTIGWSDKGDLENFIATDVNEADELQLWNALPNDFVGSSNQFSVLNVCVLRQQLYVFTTAGLFTSSALGLPIVFSFQFNEFPFLALGLINSIVVANERVFIFGGMAIYSFDGINLQRISDAIHPVSATTATYFAGFLGDYDERREELVFCVEESQAQYLLCFQTRYGTWYRRNVAFGKVFGTIGFDVNGYLYVGCSDRMLYIEWPLIGGSPVNDAANGTAFTKPLLITQLLGETLSQVKEMSSVYLGAFVNSASTTYFSTSTNVQYKVSWFVSATGVISGSPASHSSAVYTTAKASGLVSFPRVAFQTIALQIEISGLDGTKPPYQAMLTAIEPVFPITQTPR